VTERTPAALAVGVASDSGALYGRSMNERTYTTEDVAKACGVAPSTIRAYSSREQMGPPTGRLGNTPYWSADDIEPWIEGYVNGAASLRRERAAKRARSA